MSSTDYKYPLRLPPADAKAVRKLAKDSGASVNTIVGLCVRKALPGVRESLTESYARITNVAPMSPEAARRLYAKADDDTNSINLFMAAQVMSIEE